MATESRPDSIVRIEAPLLDRQLTTKQDTYRQMEKLWIEIQRLMRENR